MNDAQKLKAIIKRDKEVCTMMFKNPFGNKLGVRRETPFNYDSNNKKVTPIKIGKSRPKVGKMIGEVK